MADTDSDTNLGLEQVPLCRYRTSPKEVTHNMSTSQSRQPTYTDDSTTKWIHTPDVPARRYNRFFFFFFFHDRRKEQNEKEKQNVSGEVDVDSFFHLP